MHKFEDIIGQERIRETLAESIRRDEPIQTLIIEGETGSGKNFIADIYARALLCESDTRYEGPCGECHSCRLTESMSHPDLVRIMHEKPKTIGIDDVRTGLVNSIHTRPSLSKYRIYIIPDAEKMNPTAQNAILKTIEEPPEYAVIIMLTTSAGSLIETIRSRCQTLHLQPLPDSQIAAYLNDVLDVKGSKAELCTAFARGNIGRARLLALNEEYEEIRQSAVSLLSHIRESDQLELMNAVTEVGKWNMDPGDFLGIMTVWYRDVLLYKAVRDPDRLVFRNETRGIKDAADHISYEGIENILNALTKAKQRFRANVTKDLVIELLFLAIQENSH
ncbi:MAG: DNA polymerase III subunit delta' [Lachnospiraceae bacterium]|nr:DNA polymerase III subunit delta' [Lachnospiraceae bacterium]